MGKFDNVKLEELFNRVGVILGITDIIYFCQDENVIKQYMDLCKESNNNSKIIKKVFN